MECIPSFPLSNTNLFANRFPSDAISFPLGDDGILITCREKKKEKDPGVND